MKTRIKREVAREGKISDPDLRGRAQSLIQLFNELKAVAPEAGLPLQEVAQELEARPALATVFFQEMAKSSLSELKELLAGLNTIFKGKNTRKMLKRFIYQMRQRGLEIAIEEDSRSSRGILKEVALAPATGYTLGFDGTGSRMVALLAPKPQGGRILLISLLNGTGELEDLRALETSKKEALQVLRDLEGEADESFLEADAGHLIFLIKEAHRRHSKLDRESEKVYETILNHLPRIATLREAPIIREIFPPGQTPEGVLPDLIRLEAIPEFHFFRFKEDQLQDFREEIKRLQGNVLVLSEVQKREQVLDVVRKASDNLTQGGEEERLGRYLEEAAYLYHLKGQGEEAKTLYQAAYSLALGADPEKRKPSPLLTWMAARTLLPAEKTGGTGQEPAEKRTEAGLILPTWVKE